MTIARSKKCCRVVQVRTSRYDLRADSDKPRPRSSVIDHASDASDRARTLTRMSPFSAIATPGFGVHTWPVMRSI